MRSMYKAIALIQIMYACCIWSNVVINKNYRAHKTPWQKAYEALRNEQVRDLNKQVRDLNKQEPIPRSSHPCGSEDHTPTPTTTRTRPANAIIKEAQQTRALASTQTAVGLRARLALQQCAC